MLSRSEALNLVMATREEGHTGASGKSNNEKETHCSRES